MIRGYSPVLGLELHWDTGQLRFYDPVAGDYLPDLADALTQRDAEAAARVAPRRWSSGCAPSSAACNPTERARSTVSRSQRLRSDRFALGRLDRAFGQRPQKGLGTRG